MSRSSDVGARSPPLPFNPYQQQQQRYPPMAPPAADFPPPQFFPRPPLSNPPLDPTPPPPPPQQLYSRPPSSMLSTPPPPIPSKAPPFASPPPFAAPHQFQGLQGPPPSHPPPPPQAPYFGGSPAYQQQQQQPLPPPSQGYFAGIAPPLPGVAAPPGHDIADEFESLSISSAPGTAADVKVEALPRPPPDSCDTFAQPAWSNCHPRYFELTTNAIPASHSLAARWHLPLGAVIHPLAEAPPEEQVPVVDFGTSGIVRCRRCRTYINPYDKFTDGGKYFRCAICNLLNDVPMDYVCALDEQGKRRDAMDRPELSQGSVDFVAPMEYMVRPPMPPVYFFLIDVSITAVRSGILQIAADTIKSCLDKLPGYPRTQIGFLTFDSTLHFYSLKSSLTQPQMVVLAQVDDPFLPMPDDLLVNLSESRLVVEALLDSLPSIFANNENVESALGPALEATTSIMSEIGGKLLIFQSTLPSLGVGRLKLRGQEAHVYQTDREPALRVAEDSFYKQMAAKCSKLQIGVNVYAFSEKYTDVASLGTLAKYTGGQVCYYPGFHAAVDGEKLTYDLSRDLTRETAWEAVMRIRCGKGIKYSVFHGHFMLRSSDLLALPAVDCDKAFSVQFALEDTLLTSQLAYFQVALLYTSSSGERRIRVHTAAVPIVQELSVMYKEASIGAVVGVLSRLAVEKSLNDKLENARQYVHVKMVNALREYKNMYAVKHSLMGRIIFPESLKLLPLYVLALSKSVPLRGGFMDATPDERSAAGYQMMTMSRPSLLKLLYPTLIRLDEYLLQVMSCVDWIAKNETIVYAQGSRGGGVDSPPQLPPTAEVLDPRGAFVTSDGQRFVLWLGNVLQPEFVAAILGPQVAHSSDLRKVPVVEQENDLSKRFHALLAKLRKQNRWCHQQCVVVRQGESSRELQLVHSNMVEDRGAGFPSYMEWMVQIHRQVQQKI
ncbi:protein transport protein Sec24-like At3g07100 isoform X1 [Selaginella moellendorffii]|uniref:protein transport protein Sec24-like At3g07100 isoform X1 n=1 Tax=Selaginella moellendorffii TaxID=88036 RepID=UPI000D1C9217|nr:protein transport protein Sec24-like At3g07100 isoform X1 [Selaginella moellendorffii]|eukprot:XP_024519134.1 protein transport protein Sec24-like At3g07100 isoform X1 [Selaginella moellendorffii]